LTPLVVGRDGGYGRRVQPTNPSQHSEGVVSGGKRTGSRSLKKKEEKDKQKKIVCKQVRKDS